VPDSNSSSVTKLLKEWQDGDRSALDELMPLLHAELRKTAGFYMARESPGNSLRPTALVNEVYLRLVDQDRATWHDRAHFLAIAGEMMRRVLVDHAREKRALKRGGNIERVTLNEGLDAAKEQDLDIARLDDALQDLAALDPRQAKIVELRFFGGLTVRETADVIGLSPATVKREWATAKAWLYNELHGD
jgi:RNA polymerase sigma factor (TIGR02999 family)